MLQETFFAFTITTVNTWSSSFSFCRLYSRRRCHQEHSPWHSLLWRKHWYRNDILDRCAFTPTQAGHWPGSTPTTVVVCKRGFTVHSVESGGEMNYGWSFNVLATWGEGPCHSRAWRMQHTSWNAASLTAHQRKSVRRIGRGLWVVSLSCFRSMSYDAWLACWLAAAFSSTDWSDATRERF